MKIKEILLIILLSFISVVKAQVLYVNCNNGQDTNNGNSDSPVKTIEGAFSLIENSKHEILNLIVAPGIYFFDKTIIVRAKGNFTKINRFIIEAQHLPDDPDWKPELMPVFLTTAKPDTNFGFMYSSIGLKIDMSHVTIRGIKFCGQPSPQIPIYPIARENPNYLDLEVTQCMFIADNDASYIQVGVISPGSETTIDHCIFYNCANAAVFWFSNNGLKYRNTFSNNIIYGGSSSGIWTSDADSLFSFHHNIISNCKFALIKNFYNSSVYSISDCIITNNENYLGEWTKSGITASNFEIKEINITKEGKIDLIKVEPGKQIIDKRYMHPKLNTLGNGFDAGIFKKNK